MGYDPFLFMIDMLIYVQRMKVKIFSQTIDPLCHILFFQIWSISTILVNSYYKAYSSPDHHNSFGHLGVSNYDGMQSERDEALSMSAISKASAITIVIYSPLPIVPWVLVLISGFLKTFNNILQ